MAIKRKKVFDESGRNELIMTYSDEGKDLLQLKTGKVYKGSVVDVIAGYDESGAPCGAYEYEETGEKHAFEEDGEYLS